jgi:hypothetical protein
MYSSYNSSLHAVMFRYLHCIIRIVPLFYFVLFEQMGVYQFTNIIICIEPDNNFILDRNKLQLIVLHASYSNLCYLYSLLIFSQQCPLFHLILKAVLLSMMILNGFSLAFLNACPFVRINSFIWYLVFIFK